LLFHPERCDVTGLAGGATLRHINRRLRAGKTVKCRRRRATVRREKFRACHCSEFLEWEGRAVQFRRARRPTESATAQAGIDPGHADNLYLPRETGEEVFPYAFLRLCFAAVFSERSAYEIAFRFVAL
jgi:hypothetical protein